MLIISNWKAYVEKGEKAKALYSCALKLAKGGMHEIVLAVPAPYLGMLSAGSVAIGVQDVSGTTGGATTGEITAGLVAELGAAFLCADLELASEPRLDHAAYIADWLKVLKGDPKALTTAAGKASAAAEYITAFDRQES